MLKSKVLILLFLNLSLHSIDMTSFPKSLYTYNWGSGGSIFERREYAHPYFNSCSKYSYKGTTSWNQFKNVTINNQPYCTKSNTNAIYFDEVSKNATYNYDYQYFSNYITTYAFSVLMNSDQDFILPTNYNDFLQLNPLKVFYKVQNEDNSLTRIEIIDANGNILQTEINVSTLSILSTKNYTPNFIEDGSTNNPSISELENIPFDFSCNFNKNTNEIKTFNLYDTYELYNGTRVTMIETGDGQFIRKEYPQIQKYRNENMYVSCKNGLALEYMVYDEDSEQHSYAQNGTYQNQPYSYIKDQKISSDKKYLLKKYTNLFDSSKSYISLFEDGVKIDINEALLSNVSWRAPINTNSFLNILSGVIEKMICSDGAPSSNSNSCDRTCESVNYITQPDNTCKKELDCEVLDKQCITNCIDISNIAKFECNNTDYLAENVICECSDTSSSDLNNNGYEDAPDSGNGTGGNSLTDNMKNLGSSVVNNTDATNSNTQALENQTSKIEDNIDALNENTSVLEKISTFLTTITNMISNPNTITDSINQTLSDSANKYSQQIFNDSNCLQIEPVQISLYGRTITFLSQNFIDMFFPVDIFKNIVIFSFVFSATMSFFRGDS